MSTSPVQVSGSMSNLRIIVKRVGIVVGLVLTGVGLGILFGIGLGFSFAAIGGNPDPGTITVLNIFASQAGFAVATLGFLWIVAGVDFVETDYPNPEKSRLLIGGLLTVLTVETVRQAAVGIGLLQPGGTLPISGDLPFLTLLGIYLLVIGVTPLVEELLFRGVIQQYVTDVSTKHVGILVATVLFVPIHGFGIVLTTSDLLAIGSIVGVLAVFSVVLGIVYHRTENLLAPVLVHAGYNALIPLIGMGREALLTGSGIPLL